MATDAWTATNHRAFVGVIAYLQLEGKCVAILLDIAELPVSHSGKNMAEALKKSCDVFGITDKVSRSLGPCLNESTHSV